MSRKEDAFVFRFDPRNDAQREAVTLYDSADILFLLGPAGTGKSHLAVSLAVRDLYLNRRKHLVLCRPAVESGRGLGHLPGEVADKMAPFTKPLYRLLDKVAFGFPHSRLSVEPLDYLRGVTFEDTVAVLDEAQNATTRELKLFLTRLGRNSKLILTGDGSQSDVCPTQPDYPSDLDHVADRLTGVPGVEIFDFAPGDVVRHPLVTQILRRL